MRHGVLIWIGAGLLGGCGLGVAFERPSDEPAGPDSAPVTVSPSALPAPAPDARSTAQFDTATAADKAAARAAARKEGAGKLLGQTVASLGDPGQPGFWLRTPLVASAARGTVRLTGTGRAIAVDLLPLDGPATAGSQLSLSGFLALQAPLTALARLEVARD